MLFIPYMQDEGEPRPLGFSVVSIADGKLFDFAAGQYTSTPAPGACVRPLTWFPGADHQNLAMASADVPRPAQFGDVAVVFHEKADGGAVVGDPIPVEVMPSRSLSVAFAFAR